MAEAMKTGFVDNDAFKRDLSDVLSTLVAQRPVFLNKFFKETIKAKEHKIEWNEDVVKPTRHPYTGATASGAFTFADAKTANKFRVGDVVSIEGLAAVFEVKSVEGAVVTTELLNANGAEVAGDDGFETLTGSNVPQGAGVLCYDYRPFEEFSQRAPLVYRQTKRNHNFTQIIRRSVALSRSLENYDMYGNENKFPVQIENALLGMSRELNRVAIRGNRQQREMDDETGEETQVGRAGGLYDFGINGGNVVDAANGSEYGDLSIKLINDAAYTILSLGALPNVILCHPNQRRVLSALMQSNIILEQNDDKRGAYVKTVRSDITGEPLEIVADFDVPENDVWVMDTRGLTFATVGSEWLQAVDTEQKEFDGRLYKLLGEFSFVWKNPDARLCRIKNLTPGDRVIA